MILLVIYFASLVFQLWTHAHAYIPQDADSPNVDGKKFGKHRFLRTAQSVKRADARAGVPDISKVEYGDDEDDVEEPKMNVIAACILLAVVTALVGVTAEWLVDSINGLTSTGAISEEWVGLILVSFRGPLLLLERMVRRVGLLGLFRMSGGLHFFSVTDRR